MLPSLWESREKARQMRCAGNYHAIGQASTNYAVDNDGQLFVIWSNGQPGIDFPIRGYGFGNNGFPRNLATAQPTLPLAFDTFSIHPSQIPGSGLWSFCHTRTPSTVYRPNSSMSGYYANEGSYQDGLGSTILFYDGSVRFVSRRELVRVDAYRSQPIPSNNAVGTDIFATLSVLP